MFVRTCTHRYFSLAARKSHYEVLGLKSNATQNEIKTAFYKLSKMFHPDLQKGDNAKFQEISNAYEVIGNPKTRRLYDLGALGSDDHPLGWDPHGTNQPGSSSDDQKTQAGRVPVYGFDEWTRLHYMNSFKKGREAREEYNLRQDTRAIKRDGDQRAYLGAFISAGACLLLWWRFHTSSENDVKIKTKN